MLCTVLCCSLWEVNTAIIMLIYILLFDAYGKKKVRVTGEIYIFRIIYIFFLLYIYFYTFYGGTREAFYK